MKLTSTSIIAALCAIALTSCIQDEYDFNKVNLEMTVAPGISIPVDKTLDDVKTGDLLDMGDCDKDEDGTFVSNGEPVTKQMEISAEEVASGTVYSDEKISVPVSVPEFLKNSKTEFRFHEPQIGFTVNNPVNCPVVMKARAKSGDKSLDIVAELPAGAEAYSVSLSGSEVAELLYPVPDAITVEDISFTGVQTKSSVCAVDAGNVVYRIMASSRIKMEFEAGSEISFDSELDLEEMGADLSKIEVSVDEFEIEASVTSTFPLDLSARAQSIDGATSLEIENPVLAKATTDVKLLAKTDGKLSDIKVIVLSVNAKNSTDGPVALGEDCTLSIDIDRLKATSGITYNPGK